MPPNKPAGNSGAPASSYWHVGDNWSAGFTRWPISVLLARMPIAHVNGIRLSYATYGSGPPVVLVAPAATPSALWLLHQVPALVQAGYTAVTFENRGTAPSDIPAGPYRLADLAADTAGLISELGIGPCPVVGASLGALVTQELTLARPDLVLAAVLLATRARVDYFCQTAARASAARVRDASATSAAETV